jgi:hypothetical protein
MSSSQDFIRIEDRYGAHNYKPLDVVLSRGQGIWVESRGKKYMIFWRLFRRQTGNCPRDRQSHAEPCARWL